jgi:hypothetical protein
MHNRLVWITVFLVVVVGALTTWSLTQGQDASPRKNAPGKTNPIVAKLQESPGPDESADAGNTPIPLIPTKNKKDKIVDGNTTSPLREQVLLSAGRGGDWLFRMNAVDGRFLHGCNPALNTDLDGDHFMRQVGAAFALARAARLTSEERYAARATQAVVLLLGETKADDRDSRLRYTSLPSALLNRLGSAGMLVLAINELPAPQKDVLEQSEQMCNFIRSQLRSNGSLLCSDRPEEATSDVKQTEAHVVSAAQALYGIALSQHHRPAPWKSELLHRACAFYAPVWKKQRSLSSASYLVCAFTEAYLETKEKSFADAVFEINDWLCGLQYDRLDPRHPDWWGGFMGCQDGKIVQQTPDITTAAIAEALAEACRVAQHIGDPKRFERYSGTLELALQFVMRLQYTQGNTRHFADWYRAKLIGGFHASQQDGNLRIDYAQHAVSAMAQYAMFLGKGQ